MTTPFKEALQSGQCFLFDGSTPTVLYERGVYINRSFDEANLASPDLVKTIHEEFRAGGAQIITTNTWAANRLKLQGYGLAESLAEINRSGARLAREVLQDDAPGWVAGAIGPLGVRIEPWGPTSFDEAQGYFAEQARALLEGGVDLFVLESFADLNEIHQAILAIKKVCDLPVAAMMTPNDEGQTLYGTEPEWYIRKLADWGADLVGVNGGSGPAPLLDLLKRFKTVTDCPLILQPSAGLPRMVDGRLLYMASPEYLGEFARQAFQLGARAVGGDAGTSAAHIRAMRGALRQERAFVVGASERAEPETPHPGVPTADRSAFSRKLAEGGLRHHAWSWCRPRAPPPTSWWRRPSTARTGGWTPSTSPTGPGPWPACRPWPPRSSSSAGWASSRSCTSPAGTATCWASRATCWARPGLGLQNVLAITGDPPEAGPLPHRHRRVRRGRHRPGEHPQPAEPRAWTWAAATSACPPGSASAWAPTRWRVDMERELAAVPLQGGRRGGMGHHPADLRRRTRCSSFLDFAVPLGIPVIAGIWPLKSLRNAEFMANEVPGVRVPPGDPGAHGPVDLRPRTR